MPLSDRAKIFSPFDPLDGFRAALRAKELEIEQREERLNGQSGTHVRSHAARASDGEYPLCLTPDKGEYPRRLPLGVNSNLSAFINITIVSSVHASPRCVLFCVGDIERV